MGCTKHTMFWHQLREQFVKICFVVLVVTLPISNISNASCAPVFLFFLEIKMIFLYFYTLPPLINVRYLSIRNTMISGIVEYHLQNRNSIKSNSGNMLSSIIQCILFNFIKLNWRKTTEQIIAQKLNTSVAFILNIAMLTTQKLT